MTPEAIRLFNLLTIAITLGLVGAIVWTLRRDTTVPSYLRFVVVGYLPFAMFAFSATYEAFRRDAPVTWITLLGSLAGGSGVGSGVLAWWHTIHKAHQ